MNLLEKLLSDFLAVIPKLAGAITVLILGYVISKAVIKLLTVVLSKIGVDKLTEKLNDIDLVRQNNMQLKLSIILGNVVFYMMMLITLMAATDVLGMPALSQLISDMSNYIPNLVIALVVLMFGLLASNLIKNIVLTACKSFGIPSASVIGNFVFYFMFLTAFITALGQAKIDTSFVKNNLSIILGGGVAAFALGYGLASRDVMANFLGSMYSRKRFREGDVIKLGETIGRIVAMDNTSVVLNAPDRQIIIPLSKMMKESVEILPNDFFQLPESK
ncbi:MAG: mechanosensitive ion channel [Saprospiraceae bacterium]|nr:mechanosensitive ion channel [Saprospiraceae bacterium]